MTEHLGYEKHDPAGHNSDNSRNGAMTKALKGDFGEAPPQAASSEVACEPIENVSPLAVGVPRPKHASAFQHCILAQPFLKLPINFPNPSQSSHVRNPG